MCWNGFYDKEKDYQQRRAMMERRLKKYTEWTIKELILLQFIHMYSLIADNSRGRDIRLRELQREFRSQYIKSKYSKEVSGKRKVKFLLAAISLKTYNTLVNIMVQN